MPPTKTKSWPNANSSRAKKPDVLTNFRENDNSNVIKAEAVEDIELFNKTSAHILNKFKREKKPAVKIEFDEETSPLKKERKGLWEPANWQDFLSNVRNMKANDDDPVDARGCRKSMNENISPKTYRYQCLISLMLSSQTKEQVQFAAMDRLMTRGLTIENILAMDDEELGKLIYPVAFWKKKITYIKKTSQILKKQYNGDIPDSVDKLCKLTGVGPKIAHICMSVAWNKVTGIGVDTHVHRISNRIGWVKKPTATAEDTRESLQSWLPFELWGEVNRLLVVFGQTICLPISPNCHECLNKDICPSSGKVNIKSLKKSPLKIKMDQIKTEGSQTKLPRHNITTKKDKLDSEEQGNELHTFGPKCEDKKLPNKETNKPHGSKLKVENTDLKNFDDKTVLLVKSEQSPHAKKSAANTATKKVKEEKYTDCSRFERDVSNFLKLKPEKLLRKRKVSPKSAASDNGSNLDESQLKTEQQKVDITKVNKSRTGRNHVADEVIDDIKEKSPLKRKFPRDKATIQIITGNERNRDQN